MADENKVTETTELEDDFPPVYDDQPSKDNDQRKEQVNPDEPPPYTPDEPVEEPEPNPQDEPTKDENPVTNNNTNEQDQEQGQDQNQDQTQDQEQNQDQTQDQGQDQTQEQDQSQEINADVNSQSESNSVSGSNAQSEAESGAQSTADAEAKIGDISQQLGDLSQNQKAQQQLGDFINNQSVSGPEQTVGDFTARNQAALEQNPELKAYLEQNPDMTMGDIVSTLGDQQQNITANLERLAEVDQHATVKDLVHDIETKVNADIAANPNISNDIKSDFQQQISGFENSADNNFQDTLKNFGNNDINIGDTKTGDINIGDTKTGDVNIKDGDVVQEDGDVVVNTGDTTFSTGDTNVDLNQGDTNINLNQGDVIQGDTNVVVPVTIQIPEREGLSAEEIAFYTKMAEMQTDFYNKVIDVMADQNEKSQERLSEVYEEYIDHLKESAAEAGDKNINMTIINGDGNNVTANIGSMTTGDIVNEYGNISVEETDITDIDETNINNRRPLIHIQTPEGELPPVPAPNPQTEPPAPQSVPETSSTVVINNNQTVVTGGSPTTTEVNNEASAEANAGADADNNTVNDSNTVTETENNTQTESNAEAESGSNGTTKQEADLDNTDSYSATVVSETETKSGKLGRFLTTCLSVLSATGFPVNGMVKHLGLEEELESLGVKIPGKDYSETYEGSEQQKEDETLIKEGWNTEDFVKAGEKTYTNGEYEEAVKNAVTKFESSSERIENHSESMVFTDEEFNKFSSSAQYEIRKREFETISDYYSDKFDSMTSELSELDFESEESVTAFKDKYDIDESTYNEARKLLEQGESVDFSELKSAYVENYTKYAYTQALGKEINYDTYLEDISAEGDYGKDGKSYTEIMAELDEQFNSVSMGYENDEKAFENEELVREDLSTLYDAGAFDSVKDSDAIDLLMTEVKECGNYQDLANTLRNNPRMYIECMDAETVEKLMPSEETEDSATLSKEAAEEFAMKLINMDESELRKQLTVQYEMNSLREAASDRYLPDMNGGHIVKSAQEYFEYNNLTSVTTMETIDELAGVDYVNDYVTDAGDISGYSEIMKKKIELVGMSSDDEIADFAGNHTKSVMYTDEQFDAMSEDKQNFIMQTEHQVMETVTKDAEASTKIAGATGLSQSIDAYSSEVDYGKPDYGKPNGQSDSYQVYVNSHTINAEATMEKIKSGEYENLDTTFTNVIKNTTEAKSVKELADKIIDLRKTVSELDGFAKDVGVYVTDKIVDKVKNELEDRIADDTGKYTEDQKKAYRETIDIIYPEDDAETQLQ